MENEVNEEMERVFALEKVMPDTPEGRRLGNEAEAKESTSGIILLH